LALKNERINGDKALADIMESARKCVICIGCCTLLSGESNVIGTDVSERTHIRMGRLERECVCI